MPPAAGNGSNALDRETQIGVRPLQLDAVSRCHERFERGHALGHATVVLCADSEEEVFETLRTHHRLLRHGRGRPTEDDPLRFVHPVVEHGLHRPHDSANLGRIDIRHFKNIIRTTHRDISVHLLHPRQLPSGLRLELLVVEVVDQLAADARPLQVDKRHGTPLARGTHQRHHHGFWNVEGVNQDTLTFLQIGREAGQDGSQF